MKNWMELWAAGRVFKAAFEEQRLAIEGVYNAADEILRVPENTPFEYQVSMEAVPDSFYTLRKNIFSTLFQSMYHLMDCDPRHRLFYGKLEHFTIEKPEYSMTKTSRVHPALLQTKTHL
jgi:hypothetical protein